jgi:hypothetical protein
MVARADENLTHSAMNPRGNRRRDSNMDLYILNTIVNACREANKPEAAAKYEAVFRKYIGGMGN